MHMNRLNKESSLYLKQHANNPVDWYPWSPEALEKAKIENKPILLSIGYSACHWCHVMAHESFEDEETASLMNQFFINIKVDREERPDLDKVYQTAHNILTQQAGGWPLTVFLSPNDLTPFYSGTYFPKKARYQLPAFKEVLEAINNIYHHNYENIKEQNRSLMQILEQINSHITSDSEKSSFSFTDMPIKKAIHELKHEHDKENGGFNGAPKFPQASKLLFLSFHVPTIVIKTLTHMGEGGIYDQIGSGFFRYTIDAKWEIPHFEKMLYDNGQLLNLYASFAAHHPLFYQISYDLAHWVINTLQSNEGGYYSSIDADSEGHEGKYYLWNNEELKKILSAKEYNLIAKYYGLQFDANFEDQWHLRVCTSIAEAALSSQVTTNEAQRLLSSAKKKIYTLRQSRTPPTFDKKILTSWNALMIKGMLNTFSFLDEPLFFHSALNSLKFIYENLWLNKHLYSSYNDGKVKAVGYLDDYAFLLDALITLLQINWETKYLDFAKDLADVLINDFFDKKEYGFFFTSKNQEKILFRPKNYMDEAIPSGNGIACQNLLILGYLLDEKNYLDAVEKTLKVSWPFLINLPKEHSSLIQSLFLFLNPPNIVVIRGDKDELKHWQKICKKQNNAVFAIANEITALPLALASKKPIGKTCAYICKGFTCTNVIEDELELISYAESI